MGIKNLIASCQPYAVSSPLDHGRVVVDGPALAHHIYYLCSRTHGGIPSYKLLGETMIAWLDKLQDHHVTTEAIYFDGYLPTAKRSVRIDRVLKSTTQVTLLHGAQPKDCPRRKLDGADSSIPVLFPNFPVRKRTATLPSPPFLVPAIIDKLMQSEGYSYLTRIVPGEADSFCAQHAFSSGATVLTADSDLLVHDLGAGDVVFLWDISLVNDQGRCRLLAPKYNPLIIAQELGLPASEGIRRFAFELTNTPGATVPRLLESCRKPVGDPLAFAKFSGQYHGEATESAFECLQLSMGNLSPDPRVSELVLQYDTSHFTLLKQAQEDIQMFLPVLLDCPARPSAWENSTLVRQLAYSLVPTLDSSERPAVREYRRLQSVSSRGKEILPLSPEEMSSLAAQLSQSISWASQAAQNPKLTWLVVTVAQDIETAQSKEIESLAIKLIRTKTDVADAFPWDLIHFTAQVQATCYSYRILSQITQVAQRHGDVDIPDSVLDLCNGTTDLPGIMDYPLIGSVATSLQELREADILEPMLSAFNLQQDGSPLPDSSQNKTRQRKTDRRHKASNGTRGSSTSLSANRFSILTME